MDTDAVPSKDPLIQALEQSDNWRRQERAERIRWVSQHQVEFNGMISGSVELISLLNEARECFVEGHYIASMVLATAVIEHLLSEELVSAGKAKYGIPFDKAIQVAKDEGLFPAEMLAHADTLRVIRNPFAHRKPDGHPHTLGNRYLSQKRHPNLVVQKDAQTALIAMYGFFRHALKIGA
ncbi:hypothetical protein IAI53_10530 [Thauera sp. CAU 1555]|uniref:DUF4145 domain-containing protein n=1 Tax=Thauera sedimentorum TaxID=2767595 RepID=A0ABR9BCY9_9RHOO|nr:hypothetical protein [Thauera sedimentorum]MBC9072398.1 hypothetical protein [Thauera sedimentorum]MBD8503317.1 hypothetical protein [Thauera sedimentorum]